MNSTAPIPDYSSARRSMIDSQLRPQGVTDRVVLDAMRVIERETFLSEASRPLAYVDRSVATGDGRYLSPPSVLGQLLNQMAPKAGEKALVVASGTGYAAAVLRKIGLDVVALECSEDLAAQARGNGVDVVEGPLAEGYKKKAPYDVILVDGAIGYIPDAIVAQLSDGGRLGTALVDRGIGRLIVGRKVGGSFGFVTIGDSGVPMLPGFDRPAGFEF